MLLAVVCPMITIPHTGSRLAGILSHSARVFPDSWQVSLKRTSDQFCLPDWLSIYR